MSCMVTPVFERTTTPARGLLSYAIEAAQLGPAPSCTTISSVPRPTTYQPSAWSARVKTRDDIRLRPRRLHHCFECRREWRPDYAQTGAEQREQIVGAGEHRAGRRQGAEGQVPRRMQVGVVTHGDVGPERSPHSRST